MTKLNELISSDQFQTIKASLVRVIQEASVQIDGVRSSTLNSTEREKYLQMVSNFFALRGRMAKEYLFPLISTGFGRGPYLELMDGSIKLDLTSGLGINFFGHSNLTLIEEMIDGLASDVLQGSLLPGIETEELQRTLLHFVGAGSLLRHCWLTPCGTMANDSALKLIRQKKTPATSVIAFKNCFAGRSIAMQEITDKPAYRENQPLYAEVSYIPFYHPGYGLEKNIATSVQALKQLLHRDPRKYCCLMAELVQGDGGVNFAPPEYYSALFSEARSSGLTVWVDEIQTFGRTGELFAYQTFGLESLVDVVTIDKMFQLGAVLFSEEMNPKPFLIGSTHLTGSMAMRASRKSIELLVESNLLGGNGKIRQLSDYFLEKLKIMEASTCKGLIRDVRGIGGMIAFTPLDGTFGQVIHFLRTMFDQGALGFLCGNAIHSVRLLPPLAAMSEGDLDVACSIIEKSAQLTSLNTPMAMTTRK